MSREENKPERIGMGAMAANTIMEDIRSICYNFRVQVTLTRAMIILILALIHLP
jgi:hypothetical protein